MLTIGVRELRQHASRVLRAVASGETVQVTARGRPVALLVPPAAGSPLAALEAEGRLSEAEGDVLDLGPPIRPKSGIAPPGEALARARRAER